MRVNNLRLVGFGAELGRRVPIEDIASEQAQDLYARRGQRSVSMAHNADTGSRLAVRAAQRAWASAMHTPQGCPPEISAHFHATIWRERGVWSASSYVLRELGVPASHIWTSEVQSLSNSMVGGLWLAAQIFDDPRRPGTALLTAGDVFALPEFDPLGSDAFAYGSGGSAFVVGQQPGLARIVAVSTYADPRLEPLHRGDSPLSRLPASGPEDLRSTKRQFLSQFGVSAYHSAAFNGIRSVATEVLHDAELGMHDIDYVLLPFYAEPTLTQDALGPLGIDARQTTAELGRYLGHLGPSDHVVSLAYLYAQQHVCTGDKILAIGIGTGMTWTAALVEVECVPAAMRRLQPNALAEVEMVLNAPQREGAAS